ncbi:MULTISPECIES: hypothetical protein [Acinetobacter]|uniref:hypothetical protein n=1 Tax=Acinetobacter TaxID=469 RepID=UPI0011212AB9|nr:hypothetical protein [Acinetobacter pullicarnis]
MPSINFALRYIFVLATLLISVPSFSQDIVQEENISKNDTSSFNVQNKENIEHAMTLKQSEEQMMQENVKLSDAKIDYYHRFIVEMMDEFERQAF